MIKNSRQAAPPALMVWGTHSGAGKSWLTAALCRWAARQGLRVAPFKAQNMSNNARVVPLADGGWGEIGSAQWLQARAARVEPTVDMNPVLLKPESERRSQVVVHGRVRAALADQPWRERAVTLAAAARESLDRLRGSGLDALVMEGAGSPAEINLAPQDYVNLDSVRHAGARALIVSDIDRGGAFAHLFGTVALLPPDLQPAVAGFVLNKFRGDPALLDPAPAQLQALTGVPLAGVIPIVRDHGLPEEDGWFGGPGDALGAIPRDPSVHVRVAVVAWPQISNLDEFEPLRHVEGLRLAWARTPAALEGADWVVLPGSKQVASDLAWLRATGLDAAVARHAAAGGAVLGLCGGLQVLGEALVDPEGHDGLAGVDAPGLGRLPLVPAWRADKRVQPVRATFAPTGLAGPWAALAGVTMQGYEIHQGESVPHPDLPAPLAALRDGTGRVLGWAAGRVLGVYAHGVFEDPAVLHALFGTGVRTLDARLDGLADLVDAHLDTALLRRLLTPAAPAP